MATTCGLDCTEAVFLQSPLALSETTLQADETVITIVDTDKHFKEILV